MIQLEFKTTSTRIYEAIITCKLISRAKLDFFICCPCFLCCDYSSSFFPSKIVHCSPGILPSVYSSELRFLVMKMLEKNPKKRPNIQQMEKYSPIKQRVKQTEKRKQKDKKFKRKILFYWNIENLNALLISKFLCFLFCFSVISFNSFFNL